MPILNPPLIKGSPCYYEVLGQTPVITVLVLTVYQCDHQETLLGNNFLFGAAQPEDVVRSKCKYLLNLFINFFYELASLV